MSRICRSKNSAASSSGNHQVLIRPAIRVIRFGLEQQSRAIDLFDPIELHIFTAKIEQLAIDKQRELTGPWHDPLAIPARILLCRKRRLDRADQEQNQPGPSPRSFFS